MKGFIFLVTIAVILFSLLIYLDVKIDGRTLKFAIISRLVWLFIVALFSSLIIFIAKQLDK
jgi:hypothetical protein